MANLQIQIDDLVREMNGEELKNYQAQQAIIQQQEIEAQAKIAAKQSALAKLAALGLTKDEIEAL
jgi:hypothetical protein